MQAFDWEKAPLDRNILLEASAGTGKTYTLERLVMRLVTEREIPLPEILVVTFTNMAAREMQERIGRLLSEEAGRSTGLKEELLRRGVRDFDRAAVFTIHGFCSRVLQSLPFECGLPPGASVSGEDELTGSLVQDWFRLNEERDDPFLRQGYRAAYEREKSFPALLKKIESLIRSQRLEGDFSLVPGPMEEALLKDLCGNWKESVLLRTSRELAGECRKAGSSGELVALLKGDGLGKGLGDKTGEVFYGELLALDDFDDFSAFLSYLGGRKKAFINRVITARSSEASPASPLGRAFAAWSCELPEILAEEGGAAALSLALALLFEFRCAREVSARRNRERKGTGKLTYNDLIDLVHSLLTGPERKDSLLKTLRNRYRVLLVDEFQDTDRKQWEIFSALFDSPAGIPQVRNFFLIGDPKQSIYRFRGADLNVYLAVRDNLPEDDRYRLDTNWRSHPLLMKGFNTLFASLFGEEGRPGKIGYSPVDAGKEDVPRLLKEGEALPPVEFLAMEGEPANREEAVELWLNTQADQIEALLGSSAFTLEGDPIRASHIAVLLEDNRQCRRIQELLSGKGIPAVIFDDRDIFTTTEVSLPLYFLEAMIGRDRGESIKKLLLSPLAKLTAGELLFLEEAGFLDSLILRFRLYREKTDRGDLIGQFTRFCRLGEEIARFLEEGRFISRERAEYLGENFLVRLMGEKGGERLYTNLRHILEILHREQTGKRLNTGELYRFCRNEMFRGHSDEIYNVRLNRDGDAVRIMTLHKSKGLQFPLVFFGGGLYPSLLKRGDFLSFHRNGENWCDYLQLPGNRVSAGRDEWEERKRLYYVGLTRAESRLYLPLFTKWDDSWLSRFYHISSGGDSGENNPFEADKISLPAGTAHRAAESLRQNQPDVFALCQPLTGGRFAPSPAGKGELTAPVLPDLQLSKRYPSLVSFSSLTEESHGPAVEGDNPRGEDRREEADRDGGTDEDKAEPDAGDPVPTAENLPGGTGLGNLVHTLFEEIDYGLTALSLEEFLASAEADLFIKEKALFYFKAEWFGQYGNAVKEMVWNTLNAPLNRDNSLFLNRIPREERVHEMEFLIRLKEGSEIGLGDFLTPCREGYLKGFIDMIFLWEGRYYIADWKTTRCAPGEESPYDRESVERIMEDHSYHLQYWIYTAALTQFLEKEKDHFDFERDFGGIFYFFNRGMRPDSPGRGVFFTRPGRKELGEFMKPFTGEEA
ncbi:MAG: UvrD-helicase domain-containing protein [Spirochaetales bacterium]|nr:UvrD-helicase domain-containing protein [Spirochaetales bacterium]